MTATLNALHTVLASLPPAEREAFLKQAQAAHLPAPTPAAAAAPAAQPQQGDTNFFDMAHAKPVGPFTVILGECPHQAEGMKGKNLFFVGHRDVRGPKGGVYLRGRAVIGYGATQVKGILQIGDKYTDELIGGGAVKLWVRMDGTAERVCVGVATAFKLKEQKVEV